MNAMTVDYKSVSFQDLRVMAHAQAQQTFEKEYPAAQKRMKELGAFHTTLDTRISELQHEKVTPPSKEELLREKELNLTAYWKFREIAHKLEVLAKGFSAIVVFLTPQPRKYTEEVLKNEAPELLMSLTACDEASSKFMQSVSDWWGKVDTLQTKMFERLNSEVSYSLQKFCQIVDNEGRPLSSFTRAVDYCTTPVIPKLQSDALPSANVEKNIEQEKQVEEQPVQQPTSANKDVINDLSQSTIF
jgi:hypothetical protein